jgi:hypothetical protein
MLNPRQKQAAKLMKLALMVAFNHDTQVEVTYKSSIQLITVEIEDHHLSMNFNINMDEPNPDATLTSLINILERMCIDNDQTIGDLVTQTDEGHEL